MDKCSLELYKKIGKITAVSFGGMFLTKSFIPIMLMLPTFYIVARKHVSDLENGKFD